MEKRPMPQRGPDGRFLPQGTPPPKTRKPSFTNKCSELLKYLMSHKYAYVFNDPVDPIKLGIPDYFTVIKSPMDFGTIKAKLKSNLYSTPEEFTADVRLTFTNALKYNHPGDAVHDMAKTLSKRFEAKWKAVQKQIEKKEKERIRVGANGGMMPEMTCEKMYYIIRRFMEWPGDIPEVIVDFVRRHGASVLGDSDEMHLDLNCLSNDQMWELHGLASSCLEDSDLSVKVDASGAGAGDHMDVKID